VLTLQTGAKVRGLADVAAAASSQEPKADWVELDVEFEDWEAASENTEEVDDEADEDKDGAYG
jgi:hypothetical protein